jgi:hypothetical protein
MSRSQQDKIQSAFSWFIRAASHSTAPDTQVSIILDIDEQGYAVY